MICFSFLFVDFTSQTSLLSLEGFGKLFLCRGSSLPQILTAHVSFIRSGFKFAAVSILSKMPVFSKPPHK